MLYREGTDGVSTYGVTANFVFFDRGTFWVVPSTYFDLPKSARAYVFPQSVNITFAAAPFTVNPIRPQPTTTHSHEAKAPAIQETVLQYLHSSACLLSRLESGVARRSSNKQQTTITTNNY